MKSGLKLSPGRRGAGGRREMAVSELEWLRARGATGAHSVTAT